MMDFSTALLMVATSASLSKEANFINPFMIMQRRISFYLGSANKAMMKLLIIKVIRESYDLGTQQLVQRLLKKLFF